MIHGVVAVLLLTGSVVPAAAAEESQLDASPVLFTVLAAINGAGYDAEIDSPTNSAVRQMVRRELASKNLPVISDLKRFFGNHRQKDATAELSQYISFALAVDGPPNFRYRYRTNELPPDVVALDGLQPLIAQFYKEANIEELWRKAQPAFEEAIGRYHRPAADALMRVNAYLRNAGSGGPLGTRFQIYVDLLGAPNQVQTRSYKNDYFVVVTPSAEPQAEEIRHAYLHFLLEPMATRYAGELDKKKALLDYAQGSGMLEEHYKSDFLLLASECLIKAVESRLAPAPQRQALVEQALREGYILAPAFAELLPAYEKQEQSLRFYYPELVNAIDLKREEQRLEKVEFASERPVRKVKVAPAERPVELTGANKTLAEAEQHYAGRDLDSAKAAYLRALQQTDDKPLHAKAYYGLARIAALRKDPELAEKLFQKTLESSPDPQVKAWSYVYLGRLADAAGERQQASRHYQSALEVPGAPGGARQAAQQGLQQAFRREKSQQP